jgi:hypothetical protein
MQRAIPAILVGFALVITGSARAQGPAGTTLPLQVTLLQEPAEFEIPFYDALITVGENKFTFVVPQGFRLKSDPGAGKVILGNQEGDCSFTFSILGSSPDASPSSPAAWRAFLIRMHPEAKVLQEFTTGVAGHSGPAFDIQWRATEEIYQCERIAFVPSAYGTLVFSATSGRNAFPQTQGNFGLITGTFRASTDGKFRPIQILGEN